MGGTNSCTKAAEATSDFFKASWGMYTKLFEALEKLFVAPCGFKSAVHYSKRVQGNLRNIKSIL
jgi:hypothetical protein